MKKLLLPFFLIISMSMSAQPYFEGILTYRCFISLPQITLDASHFSHNGVDSMLIGVRGTDVHEYIPSTGIHTVYLNNQRVLIWSDFTQKGIDLPFHIPMPTLYPGLFETNEEKTIAGKKGILYKGVEDMGYGIATERNVFVTDIETEIPMDVPFMFNVGFFGEGFTKKLAVKYTIDSYSIATNKLMSRIMQSSQSYELIQMKEEEVDAFFETPKDIQFKVIKGVRHFPASTRSIMASTLNSINKSTEKMGYSFTIEDMEYAAQYGASLNEVIQASKQYMKTHDMLTEEKEGEIVVYEIEEEWDF
ncbi:MAG: hypothetical protein IJV55_06940 [Paludibacteraceae bacterium]|nr:hypothetical protein [Paludibacteraceae bacterium]